tara:strand:+ start:1771 stop:2055 length:285 start_codon:yes stop_codon:yes gene_type:complete
MIEFLLGLAIGLAVSSSDLGEPVPYQTITYTDSSRIVKVYNTSAFKYRYMPNAYAIGWNTNDYRYWETKPVRPVYVKTIHVNPKPKPKPKENKE